MPIVSSGNEALRFLRHCQTGIVLAVSKRSFYVQCDRNVFCVGLPSLGEGPLNVLLGSDQSRLPEAIVNGLSVNVGCHSPRCPSNGSSDCVNSSNEHKQRQYNGKVPSATLSALALQHAQQSLSALTPPQPHGFGWMVSQPDWHCQNALSDTASAGPDALTRSLHQQCRPALLTLSQWLRLSLERQNERCIGKSARIDDGRVRCTQPVIWNTHDMSWQVPTLLGAGPGLTPAGDDLLAGVMLALHRIDRADLATTLWEVLAPMVESRTNIISSAHLHLAAQGQCSEAMLLLLECLFSESIVKPCDGVHATAEDISDLANRMGASSGWDTLAGMSLVLHTL